MRNREGRISTIRVMLVVGYLNFLYLIILWRKALMFELHKESIDYQGLTLLFSAMVVNTGLVLLAKVVEKKLERS